MTNNNQVKVAVSNGDSIFFIIMFKTNLIEKTVAVPIILRV